MSHPRAIAPAPGAALLALLVLLLPAISLALPAGKPPLAPAQRAALSSAAEGRAMLPWQRHAMRDLAAHPAAPARATGVDGDWSLLPPPLLSESPAVYDPVRQSMFFFGGRVPNTNLSSNEVWELALSGTPTWTLVTTTGTKPLGRSGHVLLYDSRRERLLVFGGVDSMTHNDTWTLDLTTSPPAWGQSLPTGTPPSRRTYAQAVYDSLTDRIVLFGGADSVSTAQDGGPINVTADMWVLPFSGPLAWTQVSPAGTPPSVRCAGAVIYDKDRQRMVLFGGYDGTALADGFTLSLGGSPAWAPLAASGTPPAGRAIPGVIHEAPQDRMIIYGGFDGGTRNDVWALDLATPAWAELTPTGGPPSARMQAAAVYDAPRDRMVMFGGNDNNTGDVADRFWSLSLGGTIAWTDLGGRSPGRRWNAAAAVDPTRQVMWIQGGDAYGNNGREPRTDLWKLTLSGTPAWTEPATTGTALGRRLGHTAVYDDLRDRLVFFGGNDTLSMFNDVRALTLSGTPAWSTLSPAGTPPAARMYHSAVYDAVNDRMVVFGGWTGSLTLNDVWALSFSGTPTWSQLTPTGTPPQQLWGQSAALDRDLNQLIIFGGHAGTYRNDVHALTLTGPPVWSEVLPTGTPPAGRDQAAMVSLGSRMVVQGGATADGGVGSDDSWLLTLRPSPTWRQLDVGTLLPSASFGGSAVFDQSTFRLVTFGGTGITNPGAETWILQLDQAVPTLASLVSANAAPGRVELEWEVSSPLGSATVYRSSGGGAWSELGQVTPDGTGRFAYVDLDVAAGTRYGYRLGFASEGSQGAEVFSAEVWVDVPAASLFALRGMTPNPGPLGAGLVAFSLPDASPAQLEVLDVTGRRVFAREVGSLGRGEHMIRLGEGAPLAPGLYLVRLTQGGRSLTAKAVTTSR